jgi:hypothetical protein
MKKIILILFLLISGIIPLYGFWYSQTHASYSLVISDVNNKDLADRSFVFNFANVELLDDSGIVLAAGVVDGYMGLVIFYNPSQADTQQCKDNINNFIHTKEVWEVRAHCANNVTATGVCSENHKNFLHTNEERRVQRKCYPQRDGSWVPKWIDDVKYIHLSNNNCTIEKRQISITKTRNGISSYLFWWIPMPHGGGSPPWDSYNTNLKLDLKECNE